MIHPEPQSGADELACLVAAIRRDIDLDNLELPEEYFYASLPLCVIDAVFSIGVTYSSTRNTVARFCENQGWPRLLGDTVPQRSITEFIDLLAGRDPDDLATEVFGNRQRTSSRSGILKAEAALRFALVLHAHGIERFGDTEDPARNALVEKGVRKVPGQRSGISFEYFLMLAGSDRFVKADRMICRYVGKALDLTGPAAPALARRLLVGAATELATGGKPITPRALDYAVWELQRGLSADG